MTIYKQLLSDDMVSTKTLLHEAIPVTGTIVSGTYGDFRVEENVQNFTHGMFQSVYDYPFLSSSANHIFDITFGITDSTVTGSQLYSSITSQQAKKRNIYNQMAQVLMGYDKDGNIQRFDEDGDLAAGGAKINDAIFLSFSRLLVKDEIKKGSFALTLGVGHAYGNTSHNELALIKDAGAETSYRVNSPAGEYGILYIANGSQGTSSIGDYNHTTNKKACGLIYYQAGVAVLTSSVFTTDYLSSSVDWSNEALSKDADTISAHLTGSEISSSADFLRHRINNVQFNNTIELNSSVYFCRVKHNEFNYSSNPTYLSGSQIRVKTDSTDIPISYITSIGLYSADNQLMAVGKFSEPIRKDSNIELTFRLRVDY